MTELYSNNEVKLGLYSWKIQLTMQMQCIMGKTGLEEPDMKHHKYIKD